jgi:hypothetical protein
MLPLVVQVQVQMLVGAEKEKLILLSQIRGWIIKDSCSGIRAKKSESLASNYVVVYLKA